MIILKKKHEEIVKKEYKKGFEAGAVSATDVLEEEFKDKLYNLNLSNNEISNENIELHSKILNLNKKEQPFEPGAGLEHGGWSAIEDDDIPF